MKVSEIKKLNRKQQRHTPGVAEQTGFPSPATHYLEPTIDLHQELVTNTNATFFVRIEDDVYEHLRIYQEAVLIIDRSLHPAKGALALIVLEGEFSIIRIPEGASLNSESNIPSFTLWGVITYIINKAS